VGNLFAGNKTIAAAFALFATDYVTITRHAPNASDPRLSDIQTIFEGNASLQEGGGSTYVNPAGAVEVADANLFIRTSPLPTVAIFDLVLRVADGKQFVVASVSSRTALLPHLELMLKRGPQKFDQK
jgi:hypothetical protein